MNLSDLKPDLHFSGFAFLVLAIAGLLGCESPKDQDISNNGTSTKNGSSNRSIEPTQGSDAKQDDQNYVMPGINFAPPPDDAAADGWQTEELSSAASYQLQQISLLFAPKNKQSVPDLSGLVASDVSFDSLRPAEIETAFKDAAFTIRRNKDADQQTSSPNTGIDEFGEQLSNLLGFADNAHNVKKKVKLFKVDHQDSQLVTSAYMQTWGDAEQGTIQSNATWDCVWEIGDKNVTLKSVSYTHLTLPTNREV